jgi:hypothetical protein
MKLPVDTSAIAFLCALAPEPVVDFETRRPKADENGEPLYLIQLLAMGTARRICWRSRSRASLRLPFARASPSRCTAWSPSPGPWPTAPASRSAPPGSSLPWLLPKPANRREECPASHERRGRHGCKGAGPAPPTHPGRVLATPDPSCIRSEPRDAP